MIDTLEQRLTIMTKEQLSASELLIIELLFNAQETNSCALFNQYVASSQTAKDSLRSVLVNLQERGFILKSYQIPPKGASFNPLAVPINLQFTNRFYKDSLQAGRELFAVYPQFGYVGDSMVMINTVSKKFNSREQAYIAYSRAIHNNPKTHQEVLELVEWGKANNKINCSLANFIIDRRWESLKVMRAGGHGVNYDAIKLI